MPRVVKFLPDGARVRVKPGILAAAWRARTSVIPAEYACGTAQHESSFTRNEVDVEETGFTSMGVFQLSLEEASQARRPDANLLTLADSVDVLAFVAEERLAAILKAAGLERPSLDTWAYLALAHNQGLGACLKTIREHGLDWSGYKARNPQLAAMAAYGDDCVSGGARWSEVARPAS